MTFSAKWSKSFLEYFETQEDEIMKCATRYNIQPWNIYNPNSGVTNNVAESLNAVIERLLDWKELPVDCLCLSLYYLQTFYFGEIQRCMFGIGEYKLRKESESLQQGSDEVRIPKSYSPEEIIEKMKINDSINLVDEPNAEKLEDFFSVIPDRMQTECTKQYESLYQSTHPVPMFNSTECLIGSVSSSSQTSQSLQYVQQSQIALA